MVKVYANRRSPPPTQWRPHVRIKHDRDRRPAWPPGIHLAISGFLVRAMTRTKKFANAPASSYFRRNRVENFEWVGVLSCPECPP
jgi:hypothetical protein